MATFARGARLSATIGALALLFSGASAQAQSTCVGDCNNDGMVAINELIIGVNIALGSAPVSECPSFDVNGDGMVTVNELIQGVNNALNGCPPPENTPTVTETVAGDTPTATETVAVDTPTATSTVDGDTPTPTETPLPGTPTATGTPFIGESECTLNAGGGTTLFLTTAALPLTLPASGSLLISCGTVMPDGTAVCDCDVTEFDPVLIPSIGDVCVNPFAGCPQGEIDCDGGNAMDTDVKGDHNIGTCASNAACNTTCDAYCADQGASYTQIASGCEGYCLGGANAEAVCTMDTDCPGGSCVGRDPVTHEGICNCVCSGVGLGAASPAGSMSCNIGVQINVIVGGDGTCSTAPTIVLAPQCGAVTTTTATGVIINANDTPGATVPPAGPSILNGTPVTCAALEGGMAAGMKLVGGLAFFDSTLGDIYSGNVFQCNEPDPEP